ncbi:amino acid adenylation domain-containing protein [Streptomyces sp. NPDC021622]|uniref:amino acid adenylation domain-containing protein n=1 Tax=Streptomyces sp. NPDC021622 TaxID=3155013 RepID=UPI0034097114
MNLQELVIEAAARHPERLAVQGPLGELSYAALDAGADRMALQLREKGVRSGDRVLVWADKSPETVIALQAVLRLGAAYVPVNATTPAERVSLLLDGCAPRAVCVDGPRAGELAALAGTGTPWLDITAPLTGPRLRDPAPVSPDNLAYILYTSGSTGTPKGVCVTHGNARAFVDWAVRELAPTPEDRFANHAPFAFDLSVLDLYAAFAAGASVHLVPSDLAYDPSRLVDFLCSRDISVWYSVPTALTLMMRDGGLLDQSAPARLRAVLFAGEPFPVAPLRALASWTPARLLNLYGPTETNVCAFHEVGPADLTRDAPVPIGRAASGDTLRVERPDGTTAGPGEEGELVVDGPTVMRGYWGQPAQDGAYRTGDIVRPRPDGALDFLGRRDHMVKIRGNRVELGEVEAVIGTHPAVDAVAVVMSGTGLEARLVAYVVPAPGEHPTVLSVKRHCSRRLPPYMICDELRATPALPYTDNGKVDRRALARRVEGPHTVSLPVTP